MSRFLDKFRKDIKGIFWMATGVFLSLSLASFHPSDPSLNTLSRHSRWISVHNYCGYFGSFLSDLLYQFLGLAIWFLPLACIRYSLQTFKNKDAKGVSTRWLAGGFIVLVLSGLLSLYFPTTRVFEGQIPLGGILGAVLSRGLVSVFNTVGVSIILWATFLVLVVFYTEKQLAEAVPFLRSLVSAVFWLKDEIVEQLKSFTVSRKNFQLKEAVQERLQPLLASSENFKLRDTEIIKERPLSITSATQTEKSRLTRLKEAIQKSPRQVENWKLPQLDLLHEPVGTQNKVDEREIQRNARLVEQKLAEFDVTGQVVEVIPGPAVTMYEFRPAASVKINDITKLNDDLSLALSAESLRIIAPIPGRDVVGIETSNSSRAPIFMRDILESPDFWSQDIKLPVALGKDVGGEAKIVDLRKIPHLLVAGTTGSGKSVFIMSLVTSLIMRHSPKTLRLILVDPKQVDLAVFHKIPHLLLPPVKEARPAINTLKWLIREMEKRYRSMSRFGSKSIEGFNTAVESLGLQGRTEHEERNRVFEADNQGGLQGYYFQPQPYIVAVIEEFADLMSVDRNGVEPVVVRLAQMARASGIHLVLAMQSPRREVLTGLIKTNFPGRISFKVSSKVDSSIILDQRGAERLLSVGDMLYLAPGMSQPQRYHGPFLKDEEMSAVAEFWMDQGDPQFEPIMTNLAQDQSESAAVGEDRYEGDYDEDYDQVVAFVTSQKEVSASLLQRRFRFGYPKAARIIEMLETEGVVGPSNGSKPRQVLANRIE